MYYSALVSDLIYDMLKCFISEAISVKFRLVNILVVLVCDFISWAFPTSTYTGQSLLLLTCYFP